MKLIKQSYEIIPQASGLEGIYKQIEKAGRICYKSEDRITDDSYDIFIKGLIKSGHTSVLEHGTIYLYKYFDSKEDFFNSDLVINYLENPYSKVKRVRVSEEDKLGPQHCYITTNYRVILENEWEDDLQFMCEPTEYHEKRVTVQFVTNQGILREFTRHRKFSFSVESTRYCNYSKSKFNNEITYILPNWIDKNEINPQFKCTISDDWGDIIREYYYNITNEGQKHLQVNNLDVRNFLFSLGTSEQIYFSLLNQGWLPQQARGVLPLDTKCDIMMTGFVSDWKHFFDLRAIGTTGKPHPQAKELAEPLMKEFQKLNLLC